MVVYFQEGELMTSLRLKKEEAELLRERCQKENEKNIKEGKRVVTESQLLHKIIQEGLKGQEV